MGPVLVTLAATLWGTVGIASKVLYAIQDVPPLVVGFFRLAIAVPPLLAWRWWRPGSGPGAATFRFNGFDGLRILVLGGAMGLYQVCYFRAVAEIGVALATLITLCSAPVVVGILATVTLKERITPRTATALVLGLTGAALLTGAPAGEGRPAGVAWAAGSAMAYSIFVLCSRALAHHDPAKIIVVGFGIGALFLMPFALTAGVAFGIWPPTAWTALIYMGLIPTALAYLLYFKGMRETPATQASVITLAEPLTATILAFALFGERLGMASMAGALLLVATMVMLLRGSIPIRARRGAS
jgi:drug/metabolite transporter, DME family